MPIALGEKTKGSRGLPESLKELLAKKADVSRASLFYRSLQVLFLHQLEYRTAYSAW